MTSKEYKVILDCAYMNLCEEPRLPPSFRGGKSGSKDTMRLLVDKVNMNSQNLLSSTVTISAVVVDHALLELYNGIHDESPLAHIAVSICIIRFTISLFLNISVAYPFLAFYEIFCLDVMLGSKILKVVSFSDVMFISHVGR